MVDTLLWSGPEDSAGVLLWRVANRWQRDLRAALTAHDLTQAQFLLLAGLLRYAPDQPGPTQAELAAHCGVDTAQASQVLRRLQELGLVRRRVGDDMRARELFLTPAGRARVARAVPDVAAVDEAFFALLRENREPFAGALRALLGLRPRIAARRGGESGLDRNDQD